jgi:hypothetical protein
MHLKHELTGAFYFKILKNDILNFQKIMRKYVLKGNDVYYKHPKIQFEIHCIMSYTKKINLPGFEHILFTHLDL